MPIWTAWLALPRFQNNRLRSKLPAPFSIKGRILYRNRAQGVYYGSKRKLNAEPQSNWCESLYRQKATELILYGRALGLSHNEAEDVLQETFIALLKLRVQPSRPEHYCVRTFRNRALNYRRSLWRRLAREWESLRWFERTPDETGTELQAMNFLAKLPRDQREAIVLKIWHNYTFEEIGALLEVSPNTVAGRYRYGLQKLRTSLKGDTYERDERVGTSIAFLGATPPFGGT
jgi:RNA polymerase sigma-70 factor (ECF subfamily)